MTVRLFHDNYLVGDDLTSYTASSADSNFPVANTLAFVRRSKVWRTDGYFNISGGSNTIVFRETVGVDLTATIAVAEYSSISSFLAAVKTALDAAGASTYTVSQSSLSLKISITSNGAGGGGIFQLMWTDASSASMAGILGFSTGADDTGALSYTADNIRINTEEFIVWDFGQSFNPKAFILGGLRNSPLKISSGATIKIQGNATDAWSSPTEDTTLTYNDTLISSISSTGLWSGGALRYARLSLSDVDNVNGYVEVSTLYLGDYYSSTRGQPQFPLRGSYVDESTVSIGEGGNTFANIRQLTERFALSWFGLTVAEKESLDSVFENHGITKPLWIQLDPSLAFSSANEDMFKYVKFVSAPSYDLVSPGVYSVEMVFREEL